jgi:hypothetical protein
LNRSRDGGENKKLQDQWSKVETIPVDSMKATDTAANNEVFKQEH